MSASKEARGSRDHLTVLDPGKAGSSCGQSAGTSKSRAIGRAAHEAHACAESCGHPMSQCINNQPSTSAIRTARPACVVGDCVPTRGTCLRRWLRATPVHGLASPPRRKTGTFQFGPTRIHLFSLIFTVVLLIIALMLSFEIGPPRR